MEVAELGHRAMVQVRSTSAARGRPLDASRATVPRAREGSIVSRSFLRSANFLLQNCAMPRKERESGWLRLPIKNKLRNAAKTYATR